MLLELLWASWKVLQYSSNTSMQTPIEWMKEQCPLHFETYPAHSSLQRSTNCLECPLAWSQYVFFLSSLKTQLDYNSCWRPVLNWGRHGVLQMDRAVWSSLNTSGCCTFPVRIPLVPPTKSQPVKWLPVQAFCHFHTLEHMDYRPSIVCSRFSRLCIYHCRLDSITACSDLSQVVVPRDFAFLHIIWVPLQLHIRCQPIFVACFSKYYQHVLYDSSVDVSTLRLHDFLRVCISKRW